MWSLFSIILVLFLSSNSRSFAGDPLVFETDEEVPINSSLTEFVDRQYYLKVKPYNRFIKLTFSLDPGSELTRIITIDPPDSNSNWKLRVIGKIDREEFCPGDIYPKCSKNFKIIVKGETNDFSVVDAKLMIRDINDCSVEFPVKQFTLEVHESSLKDSLFWVPEAKDCDTPDNAQLNYELEQLSFKAFAIPSQQCINLKLNSILSFRIY